MDEHFDVIYINEPFNRDEWHTFDVGKTRFSDQALAEAGKHHPTAGCLPAAFASFSPH